MSREIIWTWSPTDLPDMHSILADIEREAKARGQIPDTICVSIGRWTLVEETLTDGSTVLNLVAGQEG